MLLIAFVAFLFLVLAWLVAPTGEAKPAPVAAGPLAPAGEPATA